MTKRDSRDKSAEEFEIERLDGAVVDYADLDKVLGKVRERFIIEVEGKISRDLYSGDDSEMLRAMAGVLDNMSVIRSLNNKRIQQCKELRKTLRENIRIAKEKEEERNRKIAEAQAGQHDIREAMKIKLASNQLEVSAATATEKPDVPRLKSLSELLKGIRSDSDKEQ